MQVTLPLQTLIDEGGFTPLPGYIIAFAASLVALIVMLRLGKKARSSDSKFGNLIIDLVILISAGSVIASISSSPLITSLSSSIIDGFDTTTTTAINGLSIAGGVLLAVVVILLGIAFVRTESKLWLLAFGVGLQAIAIINPWISSLLSWWINEPVQWLWNLFVGFLTAIPNITINF